MNTPFVDLGKKDEFSLKHALGNTKTILPLLKERGQKYYAVSNYCEVSNWVQQMTICQKNGIIPILGMEAFINNFRYTSENGKITVKNLFSGDEKDISELDETSRDMVTLDYPIDLFAKTVEGYYHIIQIHNDAQLNGIDKRPRTHDRFIESHGKGIVAVFPTPYSEVASLVYNQLFAQALEKFRYYEKIFDEVYLSVTIVDDPEYREINEGIIRFAQENGIKVVPVCNSHYHFPDDEEAFQTLKKLSRLRGGMFYEVDETPGMFYRSGEEVDELFHRQLKSPVFTEEVYLTARKTLDDLLTEFKPLEIDTTLRLPKFENGPAKLRELAWKGFLKHGYDKKGPEYKQRFDYEIENIIGAGFADYFLILEEVFNWYRNDMHSLGAFGRGSAAGSLILNCIGCTNVDPIKYNLLFERFLDAERFANIVKSGGQVSGQDCPDVDSDFSANKKELVKDHFANIYGANCIASIGTVGLMKTKSALKDLARLYEVPMEEINAVTAGEMRSYIDDDENPLPLEKLKQIFPSLDALLRKYPQMGRTFEKVRGSVTNWGKHAGGVLITDFDLTQQLPVRKDSDGKLVTCWQEGIAARELGQMGFVKFDILATDQLNIFEDTLRLIKETTGKELKIEDIPLDDPKALNQMNEHDTTCVFQFDTDLSDRVIDHIKGIHKFEDISALSALMRPAALANRFDEEFGKRRLQGKGVYIPDCLKRFLENTYGLPIYQEHIMQSAMYLAGMNKNDAYKFMKLIYKGKLHDKDEIQKWHDKFVNGAQEKVDAGEVKPGYPEELFKELMAFLGYGFCASHAMSYSMYSAVGLWLKAYYPLQYLCANLTVTDRASVRLNQRVHYCQSKGFKIYPPDVRYAGDSWKIYESGLMAPVTNLKGFGANDAAAVMENRPYRSVSEFMDKTGLGKAKFEILLFGGALDCFGNREYLYNWYYEFYSKKSSKKSDRMELFFEDVDQSDCFEIKTSFSPIELEMAFEELNGFSIEPDLKSKYRQFLSEHPEVKTIRDALERNTNKHFKMLCKIRSLSDFTSKAGREFVKLEFSDGEDSIGTVMQKINHDRFRSTLKAGNVIVLPVQLADKEGIYIDNLDRNEVKILEG